MASPAHPPLPRVVMGPRATVWWGIVMLVTIETVVFSSLIMSYFYLRAGAPEWPLGGIEKPDLLLPSINTLVLLISAGAIAWSHHGITRGHTHRLLIGKAVGMVFLAGFLVLKVVEYGGYDYDWRVNAYGSIVWTITGFHVAHVITVLLKSAAIWVLAWKGFFSETRFLAVEMNALYWYFVALIWVPLYATLYLSHYLL